MSSFFTPLLHLPLLFLVSPRVSQIQYRIDNARNRIGGMVLHFMFLFHVSFCDLLRLFRSRIQVVENIRRELFSQYRSVSNDARVMVDKSYTINSAYGIHTEYRIYTVRLQQLPELVPCVVRAHGVFDCLPKSVERSVLLQRTLRPLVILLKSLVADIPADTARFKRSTDAIAVIGQGP